MPNWKLLFGSGGPYGVQAAPAAPDADKVSAALDVPGAPSWSGRRVEVTHLQIRTQIVDAKGSMSNVTMCDMTRLGQSASPSPPSPPVAPPAVAPAPVAAIVKPFAKSFLWNIFGPFFWFHNPSGTGHLNDWFELYLETFSSPAPGETPGYQRHDAESRWRRRRFTHVFEATNRMYFFGSHQLVANASWAIYIYIP